MSSYSEILFDSSAQIRFLEEQIEFLKPLHGDNNPADTWEEVLVWRFQFRMFLESAYPALLPEFDRLGDDPLRGVTGNSFRLKEVGGAVRNYRAFIKSILQQVREAYDQQNTEELEELSPSEWKHLRELKTRMDPGNVYLGISAHTLLLFRNINELNGRSSDPVLILGPSGVGKTQIARVIHTSSGRSGEYIRKSAAFETTADFGIIVGDFTGYGANCGIKDIPKGGRVGLLEECENGTLFIDEIVGAPPELQTIFFDVIDGRTVRSPFRRTFEPKVRLIFATNQEPELAIKLGLLKHDFVRRLESHTIRISPLHQRRLDIFPILKEECPRLKPEAKQRKSRSAYDEKFLLALWRYKWPGQTRELINTLQYAHNRNERTLKRKQLSLDCLRLRDAGLIQEVRGLSEVDAKQELYSSVIHELERIGYEKQKGRDQILAETLGFSKSKVDADLKQLGLS